MFCDRYDLSSLCILGTVGEPINPEAWHWYHEVVGQRRCPVVDTFWQTETVRDSPPMCPPSSTPHMSSHRMTTKHLLSTAVTGFHMLLQSL